MVLICQRQSFGRSVEEKSFVYHLKLYASDNVMFGEAGTRKGTTNLNFTEARDSEWQWHQLGNNASLHLAGSRQIKCKNTFFEL